MVMAHQPSILQVGHIQVMAAVGVAIMQFKLGAAVAQEVTLVKVAAQIPLMAQQLPDYLRQFVAAAAVVAVRPQLVASTVSHILLAALAGV